MPNELTITNKNDIVIILQVTNRNKLCCKHYKDNLISKDLVDDHSIS